jgi:hypothetical protein
MLLGNILVLRLFSLKDFMNILTTQLFPVGQVVASSRFFYSHLGIVTDRWKDGEQMVISCSNRHSMVVEESMSAFRQGNSIERRPSPSALSVQEVLARARRKLGQRYDLFNWNCEHFVYESFGHPKQSPQLQLAVFVIGITALLR